MALYRLRVRTALWLVALSAAFLSGVRYGEYRATPHMKCISVDRGRDVLMLRFDVNSEGGAAEFDRQVALLRKTKTHFVVTNGRKP